jgi:hypothetical protein
MSGRKGETGKAKGIGGLRAGRPVLSPSADRITDFHFVGPGSTPGWGIFDIALPLHFSHPPLFPHSLHLTQNSTLILSTSILHIGPSRSIPLPPFSHANAHQSKRQPWPGPPPVGQTNHPRGLSQTCHHSNTLTIGGPSTGGYDRSRKGNIDGHSFLCNYFGPSEQHRLFISPPRLIPLLVLSYPFLTKRYGTYKFLLRFSGHPVPCHCATQTNGRLHVTITSIP